jgi:hypothetical protein
MAGVILRDQPQRRHDKSGPTEKADAGARRKSDLGDTPSAQPPATYSAAPLLLALPTGHTLLLLAPGVPDPPSMKTPTSSRCFGVTPPDLANRTHPSCST